MNNIAKLVANLALEYFGGLPQLIEYLCTHVDGTEKGEKLYKQLEPIIVAAQAVEGTQGG